MFRSVLTAALLAALASLSLPAQTVKLQANIPFDFHIGAALMPAGEYLVTHSSGVILVRGQYTRPKSAGVLVRATTKGIDTAGNKLVFNRYGEDYFLATVWQAGAGAGLMLPQSKREKEIASAFARSPQHAVVALRGK